MGLGIEGFVPFGEVAEAGAQGDDSYFVFLYLLCFFPIHSILFRSSCVIHIIYLSTNYHIL